jgi:NADPH:quinone reductase-like Zn-dependent oxidoreductase
MLSILRYYLPLYSAMMKAWQYSCTAGGLDVNINLADFPDPDPQALRRTEIIVKILATSVNPADYKVAEMGLPVRALTGSYPAIPGTDFAGKVHAVHSANTELKIGQLVFGRLDPPLRMGSYGEYTVANTEGTVPLPDGVSIEDASTLGTAGLTSYQALVPYIKAGDNVFINGGSGGTGTFGIQIAKASGALVTTTCSASNAALVKDLGADEVLDYKNVDVLQELIKKGQVFDHVVDNIGDDARLYKSSDKFTKPTATFVQVGVGDGSNNSKAFLNIVRNSLLSGILDRGKRQFKFLRLRNVAKDLTKLGQFVADGKVKIVTEEIFPFKNVP